MKTPSRNPQPKQRLLRTRKTSLLDIDAPLQLRGWMKSTTVLTFILGCNSPAEPYIPSEVPLRSEPIDVCLDGIAQQIEDDVTKSYDGWSVVGINYNLLDSCGNAEIIFKVDDSPCKSITGDNNTYTLGITTINDIGQSEITYYRYCAKNKGKESLQTLMHEIGHTLGIAHIPVDATNADINKGEILLHDTKGPIAGEALMNTYNDLDYVTVNDYRAFLLANKDLSVLTPLREACNINLIDSTDLPEEGEKKYIPITIHGSAAWFAAGYTKGDEEIEGAAGEDNVNVAYVPNGGEFSFYPGTVVISKNFFNKDEEVSVHGLPDGVECQHGWLTAENNAYKNNNFANSCLADDGILPDCKLPADASILKERIIISWKPSE